MEKADITGNINYEPDNHDKMIRIRNQKIQSIANDIPDLKVEGDKTGDLIVLGWGGTYGTLKDAVHRARKEGYKVSQAHLRNINPLPKNTIDVLKSFSRVLIPEINLGQLARVIRSEFLIEVEQFNLVRGLPFKTADVLKKITELVGGNNGK